MTDEQLQRIHDIEYSCDSSAELAERIVGLEDENAKLREQVVRLQVDWESERDYANQMEAKEKMAVFENAKPRELVKALDWCTENTYLRSRCDECPLKQSSTLEPECEVIMRELGMREDG